MTDMSDLDQLDIWASMSDDDLRKQCSQESIEALKRAFYELGEQYELDKRSSTEQFVKQVRDAWNLKQKGARELGAAIVEAARLKTLGRVREAANIYSRFLDSCSSPFYRQIALGELKQLQKQ